MVMDLRKSHFMGSRDVALNIRNSKIIEGIATVGCSFLGFFFVPDFPDKNNFLTKEQTKVKSSSGSCERPRMLKLTDTFNLDHLTSRRRRPW